MTKKTLIFSLIIITFVFTAYYFLIYKKSLFVTEILSQVAVTNEPANNLKEEFGCLQHGQYSDYILDNELISKKIKSADNPTTPIIVYDNNTNKEVRRFSIHDASSSVFTLWLMPCGVYVNRQLNYDFKRSKFLPDFRSELWKYDYNGNGKFLYTIYIPGDKVSNYGPSFAISPDEKYIAMTKRDYTQSGSATTGVVKDLNTFRDMYTYDGSLFNAEYPEFSGELDIESWSRDSKYIWFNIGDGPYYIAYLRLNIETKNQEVFLVPEEAMGNWSLNPDKAYMTYDDGAGWSGDEFSDEEDRVEWKRKSKKMNLYLYNLVTKEKILLETNEDPHYYYEPRWLDENTLEYKLPDGTLRYHKL